MTEDIVVLESVNDWKKLKSCKAYMNEDIEVL